ncbi:MAG: alpha/beta hydrolase [Acidiferrobacterales bacterium]|nr:alpha/beta hydrolase [Acidiferrobacterales bacterium]
MENFNRFQSKYPLKPDVVAFVEKVEASYPSHSEALSVEETRRFYEKMCARFDPPIPDDIGIQDDVVDGRDGPVPIRLYEPHATSSGTIVIYCHGGGFAIGNLNTHDTICADMAHHTGMQVVAVDYRLTPEHLFPAHFHDALDVFDALDEGNTIVCGDSAGGTLAAAVCVARHGSSRQPIGQVLIYPFLGGEILNLPSYEEASDAPLLTTADVHHFEQLRSAGNPRNDDATYFPLVFRNFSGMPPCAAFAAEFDPIRDDSVEYVKRLKAAGVKAECTVEKGLVHGYLRGRHECADIGDSFKRICDALRKLGKID